MKSALILYPHQLYKLSDLPNVDRVYMVEDPLFFGNDSTYPYSIHGTKLLFLRASMQRYMNEVLWPENIEVEYLENHSELWSAQAVATAALDGFDHIYVFDPTDLRLEARLKKAESELSAGVTLEWLESPNFYLHRSELMDFMGKKKNDFKAFYQWQRERFDVLLGPKYKPVGGAWMLDTNQRRSIKNIDVEAAPYDDYIKEAYTYVEHKFDHYHDLPNQFYWPTNHTEAVQWLDYFIETRLENYASTAQHVQIDIDWSGRALLGPLLNSGLLSPKQVIDRVIERYSAKPSYLNDTELLVRNILGHREYTRGFYLQHGNEFKNANYFGNKRSLSTDWIQSSTGITPVDELIKKARTNAYLSRHERNIVLGAAMLLSEIDPKRVYSWFQDSLLDNFDWQLGPQVFAAGQYAMGKDGLFKEPPLLDSTELVKLGVPKGDWQELWDALYYRFIDVNRDKLSKKLVKKHDDLKEDIKRVYGYRAGDFLASKTT